MALRSERGLGVHGLGTVRHRWGDHRHGRVACRDGQQRLVGGAAQLLGPGDLGVGPEAQDPGQQCRGRGVLRGEQARAVAAQLAAAVGAEHLLNPPGDDRGQDDGCLVAIVVKLPGGAVAVPRHVEVARRREIVLRARLERDAALDARQAEDPGRLAFVRVADHVPVAAQVQQRVGVHLAFGALVAPDRVVGEPDRLAPADGRLDLRQMRGHLRRVVAAEQVHRDRARSVIVERARTSQGQVLEGEPQRLRVGELALEQVQAGVQRRQLALVEIDLRQVVVLRRQRVQVALERVVGRALDGELEPHGLDLAAVGVEPAQERLVAHPAVALDGLMDLVGGDGPLLGHQKGHERQLPNQFVVVPHCHGCSGRGRDIAGNDSRPPGSSRTATVTRCSGVRLVTLHA